MRFTDAEPLRKDWEGTMAVTMQSGSPHLGRVPLMVIASENVIKILGRERDPVMTSRGLVVEDVNQLLAKIVLTGRNVKR